MASARTHAAAAGGGQVVATLPVRSLDGGVGSSMPLQARRLGRQPTGAPSARVQLVGAGEGGRRQSGAHRLAAHRTMSDIGTGNGTAARGVNVSINPRLAAFRTISEPVVAEGTPPSPRTAQSADLELTMRAGATETAVHALQGRTNGLTEDLNAMAEAFSTLNATVKDSSEGLSLLMDVMDTSVTNEQLALVEQRLEGVFEAALQDSLKPIEEAARADAAELVALRELMSREAAAAAERVDKLEMQQARIELQLAATEQLVSRIDAQTKRNEDAVAVCREAADRSEERFAARMEEELQGFARSFGKAASAMNTVVQGVDLKMQVSVETLTQSVQACNVNNVLQISQLTDYLSKSLDSAQERASASEDAMELVASRMGSMQQHLQSVATHAQDLASKALEHVSFIPLLQSELVSVKTTCLDMSHSKTASEAAIADIKAELTELAGQMREKTEAAKTTVDNSESPSSELRMDELGSAVKSLELRLASIQELSSQPPARQSTDCNTLPGTLVVGPESETTGSLPRGSEQGRPEALAELPPDPVTVLPPGAAADGSTPLASPAVSEPTASDGRSEQKGEIKEPSAPSAVTPAATPVGADGAGGKAVGE